MGAQVGAEKAATGEPRAHKPPLPILAISCLFLAVGCLDLYRGSAPLWHGAPVHFAADDLEVGVIGLAALAGGGFLLAGRNWARWLLAAWMALHVVLSLGDLTQLLGHAVIFGALVFLLFRPGAGAYFRGRE